MSVRQQSLRQQVFHQRDGGGDAISCSTDTSRWSPASRLQSDYNSPDSSDSEDRVDLLLTRSQAARPSDIGPKPPGTKKERAQAPHRQKTNYTKSRRILKLPPIKAVQASPTRIQSADMHFLKEMKNQVYDLQQQLSQATTENKLLKKVQHRHMVALQHFEESEGSLTEIITKHKNETRVLQGLLRETRTCRDNLARQLHATENKLMITKTRLQHLQELSQDQGLLEREALSFKLTKTMAELMEKDKRIMDLEKNLELSQASFNRQIVSEQKKSNEARKASCFLQKQIRELHMELRDRDKELKSCNIYANRFLKGSKSKGTQSRLVTTDELLLQPAEAMRLLEPDYAEADKWLKEQETTVDTEAVQQSLVIENQEKNDEKEAEKCTETSEQSRCSEKDPECQSEEDYDEEKAISGAAHLSQVSDIAEISVNSTEQGGKDQKYLFMDGNELNNEDDSQSDGDFAEEREESEASKESEEEVETEKYEGEMSFCDEKYVDTAELKRKGYRLPNIRHKYIFKQTTEDLHSGRPVYSGMHLKTSESTASRVEAISSDVYL